MKILGLINKILLITITLDIVSISILYEKNYADPRSIKSTFPEKKRNLIHIYLESMESSFLSKELVGYIDENFMPKLT